jgi:membrane protease YdiL (CAAX protease family)
MTEITNETPPAMEEPLPEPAPDQPSGTIHSPTWEDDETAMTFVLRAFATLLCGAFLAWAQYFSGIPTPVAWGRWIQMSVASNLVFPVGIIWLFFGQGILHQEWLKDQRSNAWNYGWNFRDWRRHLSWALVFSGVMLVIMAIFRFTPQGTAAAMSYRTGYLPPITGAGTVAMLFATTVIYMFCWEFFFRGFMLFGMAQGFGPVLAILLQTAIFGAAHWGKPMPEFYSSFAGGVILGWICWKEKSFAPAFYTHAAVHVLWLALVLIGPVPAPAPLFPTP